MTKPRLSWTEVGRVAALADRCLDRSPLAPASKNGSASTTARGDWTFTARRPATFAALASSALPAGEVAPTPPPAATPASTPVVPARTTRRVVAPDFRSVSPVIEERVEAFLAWTASELSARAAFIADEGGLPLGNQGDFGDLAAVSTSVFHLLDEYQRELPAFEVGRVLLDMVRPNGVLHIVVVRTHLGRFGVGVLCDEAIDRAGLSALESGLTTTLTE
jgi:hypothetical protein